MKNHLAALLVMGVAFAACHKNDNNMTNTANSQDQDFAMKASMGNFAEIDAGQLAANKGSSSIANFGNMMVNDHTGVNTQLKVNAKQYGFATPDSLDAEHAALKELLTSLSGRSFDSVYIHSQVADHQKSIDLYNSEISGGQSKALKDFASAVLPKIQQHLQMADSLAKNF